MLIYFLLDNILLLVHSMITAWWIRNLYLQVNTVITSSKGRFFAKTFLAPCKSAKKDNLLLFYLEFRMTHNVCK